MRKLKRSVGMTLVELMIATAVGAVLSAAAVQLFAGLIKYARVTAMTTDLQDRMRMAREIITHDVLAAGYYWRKESMTGSDPTDDTTLIVPTGAFGPAGKASGLTNWPRIPVSGVDNTGSSDILRLIVPKGGLVGANYNTTHASYKCLTGAAMTLTSHASANPDFSGMAAGAVVAGTSGNFIFLSTLGAAVAAAGAFTVGQLGAAVSTPALPAVPAYTDECQVAGRLAGEALPARLVVYPVEGRVWMAVGDDLRRCRGSTSATGPLAYNLGNCGAGNTVVAGFEDFQVRYRYLKGEVDVNGDATSAVECVTDNPDVLTDPHISTALGGGGSCGTAVRKRRAASHDGTNSFPMLRFVGFELGLVGRTLKPDGREYLNHGRRPALFNRTAGGVDSYRRASHTWRVSAPNFYIF